MARAAAIILPVLTLTLSVGCSDRSSVPPPERTEAPVADAAVAPLVIVKIERETAVRESGAIVLGRVADRRRAFVADEDDGAIVEIDLEQNVVVATTTLGARPRDLLLLADGRMAATLPDQGAIAIFSRDDAASLHEVARARPAAEPLAMALDPFDATLYVSTGASHSLVAFTVTATALEERARFSLGREPRAVLVTSNGERVLVTHASDTFVSVVSAVGKGGAGTVETRDIGNRTMCAGGSACSGARVARNAQAIVRVGERGIVVPAAQALPVPPQSFTKRYICPPRSGPDVAATLGQGGVTGYGIGTGEAGPPITFDLETLDGKDATFFGVGTPPPSAPSCLLPRAAVSSGNAVLVACLGSARVARYRAQGAFDLAAKRPARNDGFREGIVPNVSADVIAVPAGPTGIAGERDEAHIVVWSSFARAVTRLDTAAAAIKSVGRVDVPRRISRDAAWLAGRTLFFTNGDKRISTDGRACASCHVDGRDDGLTWKTPMGMRRTRMLAGQTTTGPFGWKGGNATLDAHVKATLEQLQGTGLPDDEITQLTTFVASIGKPPASSSAVAGGEVEHGRDVFTTAECSTCHATGASDRFVHDVGTGGSYLTPTLAGVATRGWLMHDGRYRTLDELIASSTSMGRGSQLSTGDRRALVRYLETL